MLSKKKVLNILYPINISNIDKSFNCFSSKKLRLSHKFDDFSLTKKEDRDNLNNPLFKKIQVNPCHINYKKVTFGNTIKVSNKRED
jgi:hypothetical protein